MRGITLDAGALIALDRNDRRVIALLERAASTGGRVTISGCALAQAIRAPAKPTRLARLARHPRTDVVGLGRKDATAVGIMLAATGGSDIADAHVVLCAERSGQAVATSDPDDLLALDPSLEVVVV